MRSIVSHKVGIDERNWAGHWNMWSLRLRLRAAAQSYLASKYDIPKAQVDLQVALLDARVSNLLKGMLHFLRIELM